MPLNPQPAHTPEPWQVDDCEDAQGNHTLRSWEDNCHGATDIPSIGTIPMEANAARIVACVNACAGIDPSAVPSLVDALEDLVETWADDDYQTHAGMVEIEADTLREIMRRLALAKGRTDDDTITKSDRVPGVKP